MKARVYGWAELKDRKNNDSENFRWACGKVFLIVETWEAGEVEIKDENNKFYIVHKSQVEPIKEITITEEDFNKAVDKAILSPKSKGILYADDTFRFKELIKEELFKDVK